MNCGARVFTLIDVHTRECVVLELARRKSPFAGRNPMQMLAAHLYEAPKPLAELGVDVPSSLDAAITRCLAKRPEDRYASAAALEEALEQYSLSDDGVSLTSIA